MHGISHSRVEMNLLIVSGESAQLSALRRLCEVQQGLGSLATAASGADALTGIRAIKPDILLLESELPDMSALDLLRSLQQIERPTSILMAADGRCTAESADLGVVDCLAKPISAERLADALERARVHEEQRMPPIRRVKAQRAIGPNPGGVALEVPDRLIGERAGRIYFLSPGDIDYIQADDNYMHLFIGASRFISRDSLKRLTPILEPQGFLRISRSILINLRRVAFAERDGRASLAFVLESGVRLTSKYRLASGAQLRLVKRGSRPASRAS
jgi:two-component system LytT family response regulator